MKANKNELRLTDITQYEDVEEGQLMLMAAGHTKSWKAIWLTNLHVNINGKHGLPRGVIKIKYSHYHGLVDCPRLCLNQRNFMWIEPLRCNNWIDMGVNLYLSSEKGFPEPLSQRDYNNMVNALLSYHISEITVEPPVVIIENSRFHPDNVMGLEDFWDK